MGDDVMDIHASQSDESLMDDLSPRPSSSGSLRGAQCEDFMTSFISWNCRGLRTRLAGSQIHHIHVPARTCVALQDISEEYRPTMQVRGYSCVRRV
ncbi:hypothetical protein TNCV_1633221 [Trichonephila clavipes]|nr:hypothetical protein TNCV_1633221 [Trichonephila clavipes]